MNTINNFDISSSGLDIELSAFYDTYLASHDFHDSFIREGDALIYTDYANLPDGWKKEVSFYGSVKGVIKQFAEYHGNIKEFISWLKYTTDVNSITDMAHSDLENIAIDIAYYLGFDNEIDLCETVLNDELFSLNFTTETVTGYSQGDVVEVIIPEELRDILGVPEDKPIVSNEHLERLIFGCPFSATLVVDGIDFNLDEILNDQYDWDKEKVLSGLPSHLKSYTESQQKIIMDFCESNLPEYLDYR